MALALAPAVTFVAGQALTNDQSCEGIADFMADA